MSQPTAAVGVLHRDGSCKPWRTRPPVASGHCRARNPRRLGPCWCSGSASHRQSEAIRAIASGYSPCCGGAPHATQPTAARGDSSHLMLEERIAPQCEVIRAIASGYSPCLWGGGAPQFGRSTSRSGRCCGMGGYGETLLLCLSGSRTVQLGAGGVQPRRHPALAGTAAGLYPPRVGLLLLRDQLPELAAAGC